MGNEREKTGEGKKEEGRERKGKEKRRKRKRKRKRKKKKEDEKDKPNRRGSSIKGALIVKAPSISAEFSSLSLCLHRRSDQAESTISVAITSGGRSRERNRGNARLPITGAHRRSDERSGDALQNYP